jgi:hypothetical protein
MSTLGLSYEDLTTNQVRSALVSYILFCVNFGAVFAIYNAEVRIIDRAKKATLSQILLESIVSIEPGEKLDKKLPNLVLPADTSQCMSLITSHSLSH